MNDDQGSNSTPTHPVADGIVVSSRVRLARNIANFPFLDACSLDQKNEIESAVLDGLDGDQNLNRLKVVDSEQLESLERQFLVELESVANSAKSDSGAEKKKSDADSVLTRDQLTRGTSVTLNEEDHLRIQVTRTGMSLARAWRDVDRLDDLIEQHLNYAYSPRWGYLTACPANVGTGMRVSVVVHLPALVLTDQIGTTLRSMNRLVTGKELFGDPLGDFYRVTNRSTLGFCESELIQTVQQATIRLVEHERDTREYLLEEEKESVVDEVQVALQQLLHSDLSDDSPSNRIQTTRLLSRVRMGIGMGLLSRKDARQVSAMFELIQLRHRMKIAVAVEDFSTASRLRDRIQCLEGGSA